jgi:hypothetical protein
LKLIVSLKKRPRPLSAEQSAQTRKREGENDRQHHPVKTGCFPAGRSQAADGRTLSKTIPQDEAKEEPQFKPDSLYSQKAL